MQFMTFWLFIFENHFFFDNFRHRKNLIFVRSVNKNEYFYINLY